MPAGPHKVLLLGGHGKIALKLTPLLLARSWTVTSVVRNRDHEAEILALGADQPGTVRVLVASLDDVKTAEDARAVLEGEDPSIVVWAAGAGGKGGPDRTRAIDRDAAKSYISAALARPAVTAFLMVSYIASRRGVPPWWTDEDRAAAAKVNNEILPHYFAAKVEADEHLLAETERRRRRGDAFRMINLRPGTLNDAKGTGKVLLGRTGARGEVSREDVARVADAMLARDDVEGYFDLLAGTEGIESAVERLVRSKHDGTEGEDLEDIYRRI